MRISRRSVIKGALGAMAGAAAAYAGYVGPVKALYHRLQTPSIGDAPAGPLSEQAQRTLRATVEALIGRPIDLEHYADFFRWHAENLNGFNSLYERFTATVSRSARQTQGCDFAACDPAVRRRILEGAFRTRSRGATGKLRTRLFARDWELFDHHIVRPIIGLFARTEVWRLAGYDSWPATPRGLERYRQPS